MNSEAGREAVEAWTRHGQVKIVVRGNSTEELMDMCKSAKDGGCFCYLVQDARLHADTTWIANSFGNIRHSRTGGRSHWWSETSMT
ncbi:Peptidyl-tRNA hydrolase PTH2 [Ostertagia ostertagi]